VDAPYCVHSGNGLVNLRHATSTRSRSSSLSRQASKDAR